MNSYENVIPQTPGIYKLLNNSNGRVYYGSTKNLYKRMMSHFLALRTNKHNNDFLQKDFNKSGESQFKFIVVELVDNTKDLLTREQIYLNEFFDNKKNCYNILPTAGSNLGYVTSEETKKKISKAFKGRPIHENTLKRLLDPSKNPFALSGEDHPKSGKRMPESARKMISVKLTGKERTKEHRENISKALTGKPLKEETKKKLRDGRRKGENNIRARQVHQFDLDMNFIRTWPYMSLAAQETDTKLSAISQCAAGKIKTANGFIWRFHL